MNKIDLQWIGTAGFIFKTPQLRFAFDPFLSRKDSQNPARLKPDDFKDIDHIFLGHGHFDHMYDVPAICAATNLTVSASPQNIGKLASLGVSPSRLQAVESGSTETLIAGQKIFGFESKHVRFDWPLVKTTLKRCGVGGCLHVMRLGISYPAGGIRTYYFEMASKKFLFISSAGCTDEELKKYAALEVDYLLLPLQGHSLIQSIGAHMAMVVRPKVIIPHHHDDFYPPMSQSIDLKPFYNDLKAQGFKGDVVELKMFEDSQL